MKNGGEAHYCFRKALVVFAHPHGNGSFMFRGCDKRAKAAVVALREDSTLAELAKY